MAVYVERAAAGTVQRAVADSKTGADEKGVSAEPIFLLWAALLIALGVLFGTLANDRWADAVTFTAPTGVGIFALFYILAQAIERLQEPFVAHIPAGSAPPGGARPTNKDAKASLEKAYVEAVQPTVAATALAPLATNVADKKRSVEQAGANLTVLLFGSSALLAMLGAGFLKAKLLQTVGVSGIVTWLDILVTGLAVGGGTKPLHDLISNLSAAKEEKKDPTKDA